MDSQVKTTSKTTNQEDQQHQINSPVSDEVFGQGEMVDAISDPLQMRNLNTKRQSSIDPLEGKDARRWNDGQEPEPEQGPGAISRLTCIL